MNRVRNEEARRRAGIEMELASGADQRALRWPWHVEIMDEYCIARRVFIADGWREDGLCCCATMRKIGRSGEPWCIYR